MIKTIFFTLFITFLSSFSTNNENVEELNLQLDRLILPEGFKIEVYASDIENARSMAISPSGTIFVGNRRADNVFALKDTDGDNKIDKKYSSWSSYLKNNPEKKL